MGNSFKKRTFGAITAVMLFAGISPRIQAASESPAAGWQGSPVQKEIKEGTLDEAQTEIGLNGYVGNVSPDAPGIDIDGDGTVDYVVEPEKIIEVSVPAEVGVVATGKGSGNNFKVDFICPAIPVVNENGKKPVQVKLTGAEVTGGKLTLKAFGNVSGYSSNDFGLKVVPVVKESFAEQDVTTLKENPLVISQRLTGAVGCTLDAAYTEAMLDAHAGAEEAKPEVTLRYGLELVP